MSNVDRSKLATGYKALGRWRPDGGKEHNEGSERRSFSSVVRLGAPYTTCILVDTSLPQVAADSCANYEVDAAALEETIVAADYSSRVQTVSEVNELCTVTHFVPPSAMPSAHALALTAGLCRFPPQRAATAANASAYRQLPGRTRIHPTESIPIDGMGCKFSGACTDALKVALAWFRAQRFHTVGE